MQLSNKLKMLSQFLTAFLKFAFNFKHFEKKVEPHKLCISEFIDVKKHAYEYV